MKIISKFQDYYDSVLAFGHDDHVTWARIQEKNVLDNSRHRYTRYRKGPDNPFFDTDVFKLAPETNERNRSPDELSKTILWVGFCGKIYPAYRFEWRNSRSDETFVKFAYSVSDVIKILKKYDPSRKELEKFKQVEKLKKYQRRWGNHGYFRRSKFKYNEVADFFEENSGVEEVDMFIKYKTPTFIIEYKFEESARGPAYVLTTAPCLKDVYFQTIKDPYSAYQEIEQYISGILGLNDPDIVHIDDKHMKSQKGFDDYSFKKSPTKKR